jgi:flagellin-specific chaperone FliS
MDVGGRPAQALSEFYASIFAQILQASQSASKPKFEYVIECVKNVREAWHLVAREPVVNPTPLQVNGINQDSGRQASTAPTTVRRQPLHRNWNA